MSAFGGKTLRRRLMMLAANTGRRSVLLGHRAWRLTMTRLIFAAIAALAGVFFGPPPATAQAPWCAVITVDNSTVYWDCQYSSLEQCLPNVLAVNCGWCYIDLSFV